MLIKPALLALTSLSLLTAANPVLPRQGGGAEPPESASPAPGPGPATPPGPTSPEPAPGTPPPGSAPPPETQPPGTGPSAPPAGGCPAAGGAGTAQCCHSLLPVAGLDALTGLLSALPLNSLPIVGPLIGSLGLNCASTTGAACAPSQAAACCQGLALPSVLPSLPVPGLSSLSLNCLPIPLDALGGLGGLAGAGGAGAGGAGAGGLGSLLGGGGL